MLYNSCVYLPVCWSIWVVLYIQVTWHEGKLIRHYLYFQKNSNVAAWTAMINSTRGLKMENSFSEHLTCKREAWQVTTQLAFHSIILGFPCGSAGKKSACNAEDLGLIPGLGRSPGEGKGYPLQHSALENFMDYIVHEITESQTRWSHFHFLLFCLWRHQKYYQFFMFFFLNITSVSFSMELTP